MSVSSDRTAPWEELQHERHGEQAESGDTRPCLWIDEQEAGDDEHPSYRERRIAEEPPLESAHQREDARHRDKRGRRDRYPVRVRKGLERTGEEESVALRIEDEDERHEERRRGVLPALQRR